MPLFGSVGTSAYTERKQRDLAAVLRRHMAIVRQIKQKYGRRLIYNFIDLTAGPGLVGGLPGSPAIALAEADRMGIPIVARFMERDLDSAEALQENLAGMGYDPKTFRVF